MTIHKYIPHLPSITGKTAGAGISKAAAVDGGATVREGKSVGTGGGRPQKDTAALQLQ